MFQTENWSERGKRTRRKWDGRYQKSVERTSKWFWFGALRICCWRYSSRNLQFWINATTARRGVFRRQDFIRLWLTLDFNTFTYQTWNQGSLDRVIWTVQSLLSDYWLSKIFSRLVYLWNYSFLQFIQLYTVLFDLSNFHQQMSPCLITSPLLGQQWSIRWLKRTFSLQQASPVEPVWVKGLRFGNWPQHWRSFFVTENRVQKMLTVVRFCKRIVPLK